MEEISGGPVDAGLLLEEKAPGTAAGRSVSLGDTHTLVHTKMHLASLPGPGGPFAVLVWQALNAQNWQIVEFATYSCGAVPCRR